MSQKSTVRLAACQDIRQIVALCKQAHAESVYSEIAEIGEEELRGHLFGCIMSESGPVMGAQPVFVADNGGDIEGVIIGVIAPVYRILTLPMLTDQIWYAAPDAHPATAMKLLNALHKWADDMPGPLLKRHGVNGEISDPERTAKVFKRKGYRLVGQIYELE